MDETAKKLMDRIRTLVLQKREIENELRVLERALEVAHVKPDFDWQIIGSDEPLYVRDQPFRNRTLPEAFEIILKDHPGAWFTKTQIEYFVIRGGYQFNTKDSKNSVGVTLQRMIADGRVEARRMRGSQGNQYTWLGEKQATVQDGDQNGSPMSGQVPDVQAS